MQVPVICVTMGTTDSFAVDPVAEVVRIRDKLAAKHGCVPGGQAGDGLVTPHIHVDAAVGWPLLFFNNYDWQENPVGINRAGQRVCQHHTCRSVVPCGNVQAHALMRSSI